MVELAISLHHERGGIISVLDPSTQQWGSMDCMDHVLIVAVDTDIETAMSWCGGAGYYTDVLNEDGIKIDEEFTMTKRYSYGVDVDALDIDLDVIRVSNWSVPNILVTDVVAR